MSVSTCGVACLASESLYARMLGGVGMGSILPLHSQEQHGRSNPVGIINSARGRSPNDRARIMDALMQKCIVAMFYVLLCVCSPTDAEQAGVICRSIMDYLLGHTLVGLQISSDLAMLYVPM
jgi:hypothetical protein